MTDSIRDKLAIAYGGVLADEQTEGELHLAIANAMLAVAEIRKLPGGDAAYERWKARVRQETQRRAAS